MADKKYGAGILVYRLKDGKAEVFLVHPGGPFWAKKDHWGIPKGDRRDGEDLLDVAKREFEEEVGSPPPDGVLTDLGEAKRTDGRVIKVWAVEGELDPADLRSNMATIEWPPRSGQQIQVPEVDKAQWMDLAKALRKMHAYQQPFINRLADALNLSLGNPAEPKQPSLF